MNFHSRKQVLRHLSCILGCALVASFFVGQIGAQDATPATPGAASEQVLGSITAVDPAGHTITVKGDKDGAEHVVSVANTRTLLKVAPGSKDLKSATRISADDLAAGDRVSIRGSMSDDNSKTIAARSVVLMSARDLQSVHQAETAAWQNSTAGTVTNVDAGAHSIAISMRAPEGAKALTVQASQDAKFTRYNPENPKVPAASQISDIQVGDQVRVIGKSSEDGSSIAAEKIFSGAFRTIPGLITSIAADGKEISMKDLQSKQQVRIALTPESTVHKLPQPMALMLARRFNPQTAAGASPSATNQPPSGSSRPDRPASGQFPGAGMRRPGGGDLSRMLERVPQINASELKPGDAIVVSGAMAKDKSQLIASSVIAGVEPIFQSAPPRQGQSLGGDWSLDMAMPAQ